MSASHARNTKLQIAAVSSAIALALLAGSSQAQISQSAERKNMQRTGHTDLQGRSSYQPTPITYPDGRVILFAGLHSTIPIVRAPCPAGTLPNPLNGNACEANGTMIIDVTDANNPVEVFHIPATTGGQSTMVRACRGDKLPGGDSNSVYIIRSVQGGPSSGYEQWDVTNPAAPRRLKALTGIRSTHKLWWECSTGIAYMPGSLDATHSPIGAAGVWRQSQSMVIYDWSNPNNGQPPVYIRTFGLPGAQPSGTGNVPPALHGPISAHDHPKASQSLAGSTDSTDVIGNRIYAAWGVGDDGVMTIIDRNKLLPAAYGGSWVPGPGAGGVGTTADNPAESDLYGPTSPTVGYYLMSPDQGGHSSWPIFGLQPKGFANFSELKTRDIVVITSEATANTANGFCTDNPHVGFVVDVTIENSFTSTGPEHAPQQSYQGPMGLGTLWVDPRFGERYPRGNYCNRPVRFGTHSTDENFNSPLVGKLTTVAWFNGGLRVWDIREPFNVMQVAFYVPEGNANTPPLQGGQLAYMTNNVDIDNRGFIYIVDRNGAGMDILQLTGCAAQIVMANGACPRIDNP